MTIDMTSLEKKQQLRRGMMMIDEGGSVNKQLD